MIFYTLNPAIFSDVRVSSICEVPYLFGYDYYAKKGCDEVFFLLLLMDLRDIYMHSFLHPFFFPTFDSFYADHSFFYGIYNVSLVFSTISPFTLNR